MDTRPQKTAKFAVLPPDHAGFPNRVKRSESSDTTPTSHVQKVRKRQIMGRIEVPCEVCQNIHETHRESR